MIGKPSIKSALKLTAATIYGQEFQLRSLDTGEIRNKFEYLIIKPQRLNCAGIMLFYISPSGVTYLALVICNEVLLSGRTMK
jgi:hypothetical protein